MLLLTDGVHPYRQPIPTALFCRLPRCRLMLWPNGTTYAFCVHRIEIWIRVCVSVGIIFDPLSSSALKRRSLIKSYNTIWHWNYGQTVAHRAKYWQCVRKSWMGFRLELFSTRQLPLTPYQSWWTRSVTIAFKTTVEFHYICRLENFVQRIDRRP